MIAFAVPGIKWQISSVRSPSSLPRAPDPRRVFCAQHAAHMQTCFKVTFVISHELPEIASAAALSKYKIKSLQLA